MEAKLARQTHKTAIQLHLVAESCTICSSRFRQPVRKLFDTPSYHVRHYASRWIRRMLWNDLGKYDVRYEENYTSSGTCPMAFYVTIGAEPSGSTDTSIGWNHLAREFPTQNSEIIIKNSFRESTLWGCDINQTNSEHGTYAKSYTKFLLENVKVRGHLRELDVDWRITSTHLDLRGRKWREAGEDYIMRSFSKY
jgi:hypothetical protein